MTKRKGSVSDLLSSRATTEEKGSPAPQPNRDGCPCMRYVAENSPLRRGRQRPGLARSPMANATAKGPNVSGTFLSCRMRRVSPLRLHTRASGTIFAQDMRHLAHIRSEKFCSVRKHIFREEFEIHMQKYMEDWAHYRWSRVFGLAQAAELLRHSTHRKSRKKSSRKFHRLHVHILGGEARDRAVVRGRLLTEMLGGDGRLLRDHRLLNDRRLLDDRQRLLRLVDGGRLLRLHRRLRLNRRLRLHRRLRLRGLHFAGQERAGP